MLTALAPDEHISAAHRAKRAYIYVRQSSVNQMKHHRESTELQYRLVDRAIRFGWRRHALPRGPSNPNTLSVPLTALVFGAHGMQVATVDGNNRVALKRVRLGRNFGNLVEIESGISLTDRLVDNPPESTETGELVQVDGKAPTVAVAGKPSASSAKAD